MTVRHTNAGRGGSANARRKAAAPPPPRVPTPIVPPASIAGRALTAVIAIMSFLACLTAGAVHLINQSASAWFRDIASEVTVQVSPIVNENMEQRVKSVSLFLARQTGFNRVRPLSNKESGALLEPWLGNPEGLSELPLPRLIAVEINRINPPDLKQVRTVLSNRFKGVTLDDHSLWQAQIRTVTRSLAVGGLAVLALVALATMAVIISATRSTMASNRDIIEVLNFVGARQKFIAREFQRHFLFLGIRAGLLGAVTAGTVFAIMPLIMRFLGGGTITMAELRRFIGPASLDFAGYMWLVLVVIAITGICVVTSRYWVDHILEASEQGVGDLGEHQAGGGIFARWRSRHRPIYRGEGGSGIRGLYRVTRGIRQILRVALLILFLFIGGFVYFAASLETGRAEPAGQTDGIVVLTGGKSRINEAVRLLAAGKAKRLLISGVHASTTQAQLAKVSPASRPLFDCCIDLGREARNTNGNAIEARNWARSRDFLSLIVVTSSYHMPRAMAELERVMPSTSLIPYSVVTDTLRIDSWWSDRATMGILMTEYIKFLPAFARLHVMKAMSLFK